jgi:Reverse transcriptase (RNA-dependent DNA polymerase)
MKLVDLFDIDIGSGLSPDDVFIGLADHGLFAEKIPPCFGSLGLAAQLEPGLLQILDEADENKLKKSIDKRAHDYMRYEALRDINIPRHLGISHPESHVVQALAIKKHWLEIEEHCDKPDQKISRIHVRHVGGGRIFEMNYKGAEKFALEEDELVWASGSRYLVKADVSSCFPSIYTHSIPWALHTRAKAKSKRKLTELAGNLLDKCTQITRDSQTNGLLIGPHSANIISEIILTTVDVRLLSLGYRKLKRHIDDYEFYASSHDEAERFIRDLGLALREYELSINEKKTQIQSLPRPSLENWVRQLNLFQFPNEEEMRFGSVRAFLDLALELADSSGSSAPLNYALQMIPEKLNARAKRLFVQEAINLALFYPYLAPLLEKHVFTKHRHNGIANTIGTFCDALCRIGIQKLYPDAIAHSLYYALKYKQRIKLTPTETDAILELNDGITTVLFLEYAKKFKLTRAQKLIKDRASALRQEEQRIQDRQWLLVYQTWTESELRNKGHEFLADLKKKLFQFYTPP